MVNIVTKTIKLKLLTDTSQDLLLKSVSNEYKQVCNFVSNWVFDNGFVLNFMRLQEKIYHCIRENFQLNSQMVTSALKTVTARYKTAKEQLNQNPYHYQDDNGKWQHLSKTLDWLRKPVKFRAPQCDLVRNRNYRLLNDGKISITTLEGTISVDFLAPPEWQMLLNEGWYLGTSKLIRQNKSWYLCVPMSKTTELCDKKSIEKIVGIDRGLNFIVATADNLNKSFFYNGRAIQHKRHKFAKTRQKLQLKNTRNARRRLLIIGKRENRWMSDVNHCLTKALVSNYDSDTLFVLEDLTGITFDEKILSGTNQQRNDKRAWAFYQLEQFLKYKADEVGSLVINVSAKYTSQRCPKCRIVDKTQRHHNDHEYRCSCGYRTNDDRVGALNLLELGRRFLDGDSKPKFVKTKTISIAD